ncbi:hypothetical protein NKJ09_25940 [Mesorhizobium sp. M0189]
MNDNPAQAIVRAAHQMVNYGGNILDDDLIVVIIDCDEFAFSSGNGCSP